MISSSLLLPLLLTLTISLSTLPLAKGDAFDDLWSKYAQAAETKKYESTVSRRERNYDHWDVPTAAAYLGLHPETLTPLPRYASESSSNESAATVGASGSGGAVADASASSSAVSTSLTDEYVGHDAAILFYAQWCRNCHAVAPSWDAIATHLNAGSRSSNLVMALFDCEKDAKHMELCVAAGVQAYPTIMFVGSGEYHDTDLITSSVLGKDKSAGPFGATTLRRTVKFQGNWQYGDQILDWVSIMKGLSSWHSVTESGPLRGLRNGLFRFLTGGKYKGGKGKKASGKEGSLPVGVPPNFQTELRGMTSGSATGGAGGGSGSSSAESVIAASALEVKALETKLDATVKEKELYENAVTHSSHLVECLLFPKNTTDATSPAVVHDPFTILTNSDGWYENATTLPKDAPNNQHPQILRSCTLELTIDYCTRITSRETSAYIEELNAIPESDPFPTLEEIEARLLNDVKKEEPYCSSIEMCVLGNFEQEECRPAKCPFENDRACGYVSSCLDGSIQDEYGVALGLIDKGEKVMDKDWSGVSVAGGVADESKTTVDADAGATADGNTNAGVGGWGVPAN